MLPPLSRLTSACAATALVLACCASAQRGAGLDPHLRIDQLGYLPRGAKVCVLREPQIGFDAPAPFTPGAAVEVRRAGDDSLAWSGAPLPWSLGAVHTQSGDRAWWLDFSDLREIGSFYVLDPASGRRSAEFRIAADAYADALRHALRMFYLQRCGAPKLAVHTHPWTDGVCHHGAEQDLDCRPVLDPVPGSGRDLSGGWHDAGDYNKYVNIADEVVHDLLTAYRLAPGYWTDDLDIPESGNGVADILDEVRWELEWLLRMQLANGSVLHKVSVTAFQAASPPSADGAVRRHGPATASATASACGAFAHAAAVFGSVRDPSAQAFAQRLQAAALSAWRWLATHPQAVPSSYNNAGFQSTAAEDDAYTQEMNRLRAAAWLFALTGDPVYRAVFDAGYSQAHLMVWAWASPYERGFHDAMLAYGEFSGATPSVAQAIRAAFANSVVQTHLAPVLQRDDPYGAPFDDQGYHWGSNGAKCSQGVLFLQLARYGPDPTWSPQAVAAAEGYIHFMHGVNPGGWTFLTALPGAEGAVTEMYHAWFEDGSIWDSSVSSPVGPPPGFVTGGINQFFAPDPSYSGPPLQPPMGQPIQKSYRDWNTSWPESSWEVTEPSIGYQGAYVRLLAEFAASPAPRLGLSVSALVVGQSATLEVAGAMPQSAVAIVWAGSQGRTVLGVPGWSFDLGLDLVAGSPGNAVLGWGLADAQGRFAQVAGSVPAPIVGLEFFFQASQAAGSPPVQSSVQRVIVR